MLFGKDGGGVELCLPGLTARLFDLLLLGKGLALLQVCTGTETCIYCRGENQGSCRTLLVFTGHAAESLVPRGSRELLPSCGIILFVYGVDFVAERRQQRPGYGIPCRWPIKFQDANVTRVWGGDVRDTDEGSGVGLGRVSCESCNRSAELEGRGRIERQRESRRHFFFFFFSNVWLICGAPQLLTGAEVSSIRGRSAVVARSFADAG